MSLSIFSTAYESWLSGGFWMLAIAAVQAASLVLIVERFTALYLMRKPNQKKKVYAFEADIKSGLIDKVLQNAKALATRSPIGHVVFAGASAAKNFGGKDEIQLKMNEVVLEESSRIDKRTQFLSMLANSATLLGLLGTIVGLIQAFSAVAGDDPSKSALLAQGVATAMYTTAYGLITAIPALVMYSVLQNRTARLEDDLDKASLKAFIWLTYHYEALPDQVKKTTRKAR